MAYDSANKKLYTTASEGISTSEVAACLGDYRVTARGRDIGLLCTSPKINLWAKYKPVGDPTRKPLKDKSMGYRGNNGAGTCGISYVTYNQYDLLGGIVTTDSNTKNKPYFGDLIKSRTADHTYVAPKGGTAEPFRLLDFDGYNHRSVSIWNVDYPTIGGGKPSEVYFPNFVIGTNTLLKNISHSNPSTLTLIDIMQGMKASTATTLSLYKMSSFSDIYNYSFTRDYDVDNSKSYGYIGVIATVSDENGKYLAVGFCSKSVGSTTGDSGRDFNSDISAIMDALGAKPNRKLMLVPVICNYSTGGEWVVFSLDAMPYFKAIPLPMEKEWYKEYEMTGKELITIAASLSAYPTNTEINGNMVYAPNTISGGLDLNVTQAISGTLSVRYMQNNSVLGATTLNVTGAKNLRLGMWKSYNTSNDLFYKATGKTGGFYSALDNGPIFIELEYTTGGSTDQWTTPKPNWAFGTNTIIIDKA